MQTDLAGSPTNVELDVCEDRMQLSGMDFRLPSVVLKLSSAHGFCFTTDVFIGCFAIFAATGNKAQMGCLSNA